MVRLNDRGGVAVLGGHFQLAGPQAGMLLGMLPPTAGSASIAGYNSTRQPEEVKRYVGLVSTTAGLYQHLSVRELLLFFADLYGVAPDQARAELDRLSQLLGIRDLLRRRCNTLSTGQRQRVSLARALIHRPPVMLLDEPTLGLDVIGSQLVVEYIEHLRRDGKAVISAEVAGIFQRLGSSADRWQARLEKLKTGRLLGRFFAATRARLREVATALGVHHVANLDGCPAR